MKYRTYLHLCVAGCRWGGFCLIVGMAKCCIDERQDSKMAWTVSGLMKIVTTLVVYKTPDTNFHRLCCRGCIFGLAGAIIGALQNIYLSCSNALKSEREREVQGYDAQWLIPVYFFHVNKGIGIFIFVIISAMPTNNKNVKC